jgi:hypothetical protein
MLEGPGVHRNGLAQKLVETWVAQERDGFLLTDPAAVEILVCEAVDQTCDVTYRFQWMPHREIRGNVAELEHRGILNPNRDKRKLFRDPRDPQGQHCFLCAENIAECHPMEVLVPLRLADRDYFAGANFAWIASDHFTVMATEHVDQAYSRHVLEAMLDLHQQTAGRFRVLFNGPGAGASIPWHLHYQITTAPMPIERLQPGREECYPTAVQRFPVGGDGLDHAHFAAMQWLDGDPQQRSLNILVTTVGAEPCIFIFPRDQRYSSAPGKGLVGGFEVAGDFVLSSEHEEETFHEATVKTARDILGQVRPPDWPCATDSK